jgi:hypothetical protein
MKSAKWSGLVLKASLRFPEQDLRYEAITDAFPSSFGWVWKKELNLMKWLLKDPGVYWIRGKPGSGKSTLMKYLYKNEKFRQELKTTGQIDLWFFFNERGEYLQKTFEGLLRTIVHELLDRVPSFAKRVLDWYLEIPYAVRGSWSIAELRKVFSIALEQTDAEMELVIFLDALDEYHGFPEAIAGWIKDLTDPAGRKPGLTTVKVCLSSRPWDAFITEFGKAPGFNLHEHTVQDIRQYTEAMIQPLCKQQFQLTHMSPHWHRIPAERVIAAIADAAEGVFLWVRLAIDLLERTDHCDSDEDFEELLRSIPGNLDDFYARMLERIPQNNRLEAFVFLEIVYRSPRLLNVQQLCLAAECAKSNDFKTCKYLIQEKETSLRSPGDAQQRLLNFCAGLLECVETKGEEPYVQFIHRTAKDFVGHTGFTKHLLGERHDMQLDNGFTYLFRYHVAKGRIPINPDDQLLTLARADEMTTGRPEATFINSIPDDHFQYSYQNMRSSNFRDAYPTPLAFAIIADLRLYIRSVLATMRISELSTKSRFEVLPAIAWRALHCSYQRPALGVPPAPFNLEDMWEFFIKRGADPSVEGTEGLSAWDILIAGEATDIMRDSLDKLTDHLAVLVDILLEHSKQDPNALVRYLPRSTLYYGSNTHELYFSLEAASEQGLPFAALGDGAHSKTRVSQTLAALHICNVKISKVLLKHGALPNVLSRNGHTPLDLTVLAFTTRSAQETHDKIVLLATHGGYVTLLGATFWYQTLKVMADRAISLSPSILDVPLDPILKTGTNLSRLESHWKREGHKDVLLGHAAPTPVWVSASARGLEGQKKKSRTRRFFGLFRSRH